MWLGALLRLFRQVLLRQQPMPPNPDKSQRQKNLNGAQYRLEMALINPHENLPANNRPDKTCYDHRSDQRHPLTECEAEKTKRNGF